MKKLVFGRGTVALAVATLLPMTTAIHAFAATTFDSQYQANATQEANLLNTAQSSSFSDAYTVALSQAISNINSQVGALYAAEQVLAARQAQTDQLDAKNAQTELQALQQQRQQLLRQLEFAWHDVNRWFHGHNKHDRDLYSRAHDNWAQLYKQLVDINKQIESLRDVEDGQSHAYDNGLHQLQNSILQLQQAAIYYTKEWIAAEQGNTSPTPNGLPAPTATVNSMYVIRSITVSGALVGATAMLYNNATGQEVASTSVGNLGTAVFNDVVPGQYYVVQTLNGAVSPHSNVVTVSAFLPQPILSLSQSGGYTQVMVRGGASGATATLYNANGNAIQSTTVDSAGNASFTQVPAGTYYVVESQYGYQSTSSNRVTVSNELVTPAISSSTVNGVVNISVTGGVPSQVVYLYNNANGAFVGSAVLDAQGHTVFSNVAPGSYYVVEQGSSTMSNHSNVLSVN